MHVEDNGISIDAWRNGPPKIVMPALPNSMLEAKDSPSRRPGGTLFFDFEPGLPFSRRRLEPYHAADPEDLFQHIACSRPEQAESPLKAL
jgi:hypothetical protein